MQVNAAMLASELRRRRVGPRSIVDALDALDGVDRSTWVLGELRTAPTPLLVLAALSLTDDQDVRRSGPRAMHPARGRFARLRPDGA